ncbi:hypothetical protein [Chelativorans sp.]|uniref:hypothetical protein n=1 Tax=Chelativorans sp. TaxID=2203393 RepID=UPI0028112836|nr:hypothetical protein [Chelativorans sp.]
MRRAIVVTTGLLVLPLFGGAAWGQNEERYRLERTENGYVRMDTQTGAMTLCQERSGELVCRTATDEPTANAAGEAGGSDIQALHERLTALEERVKALEGSNGTNLPLEQEFEQSLNLMERFFRRFVDIVRGLEAEQEQAPSEQGAAPGQRT